MRAVESELESDRALAVEGLVLEETNGRRRQEKAWTWGKREGTGAGADVHENITSCLDQVEGNEVFCPRCETISLFLLCGFIHIAVQAGCASLAA